MSAVKIPSLRVKAVSGNRRRGGLAFTREPRDVTPADLPEGFASVIAIAAILSDPQLVALVVEGGTERAVTAEEREALEAIVAAEQARVVPTAPPTVEAGEASELAALHVELDQARSEIAALQSQVSSVTSQFGAVKDARDTTQADLATARDALTSAEAEIAQLREQLAAAEKAGEAKAPETQSEAKPAERKSAPAKAKD